MRKIKVLHLINELMHGGTERILYDTLSRLNRDRFELCVCCTSSPGFASVQNQFNQIGIPTGFVPCDKGLRSGGFRQIRKLAGHTRSKQFDVAHTHGLTNNLYARAAAILAGVPIVLTHEHNLFEETWRDHVLWNLLNLRTYRNIAVSGTIAAHRRQACPRYSDKVVTIINGIDLARFQPAPTVVSGTKERLGLKIPQPVVGTAGRLVDWKRHDLFIKASSLVVKDNPGIQFVIVGNGPEENNLRQLADRLGLSEHIRFLGWQSEMEEIYNMMDVMVMTSNEKEGFGLTSAEAMACGKPVIAVDIPVHAEVITPECGILVDPRPESIASGIKEVLDNPELGHRLGMQGRKRAEEKFDITGTAKALSSLYEEAVEAKLTGVRQ